MADDKFDRFMTDLMRNMIKPSTADPKAKEHKEMLKEFVINALKDPNPEAIARDGAKKGLQWMGDQYIQGLQNNKMQPIVTNLLVPGMIDGVRSGVGLGPTNKTDSFSTIAVNIGIPPQIAKSIYNGGVNIGASAMNKLNPAEAKNAKEALGIYGSTQKLGEKLLTSWASNATMWNAKDGNIITQIIENRNTGGNKAAEATPDKTTATLPKAGEPNPKQATDAQKATEQKNQKEEKAKIKEVKPKTEVQNKI